MPLKLGKNSISVFSRFNLQTSFEGHNRICRNCKLFSSSIGYASYIGWDSDIINTKIGRFTCIGPRTKVVVGNHPLSPFVSIHPCFYSKRKQAGFTYVKSDNDLYEEFNYLDEANQISVEIGSDVWIGADVRILEGVRIGDGAVVATGALVTKSIAAFEIWGGVPAKKIGDRFSEVQKDYLSRVEWWKRDPEWIEANAESFTDIDKFMKHVK